MANYLKWQPRDGGLDRGRVVLQAGDPLETLARYEVVSSIGGGWSAHRDEDPCDGLCRGVALTQALDACELDVHSRLMARLVSQMKGGNK